MSQADGGVRAGHEAMQGAVGGGHDKQGWTREASSTRPTLDSSDSAPRGPRHPSVAGSSATRPLRPCSWLVLSLRASGSVLRTTPSLSAVTARTESMHMHLLRSVA